jgi:hypothetical protein
MEMKEEVRILLESEMSVSRSLAMETPAQRYFRSLQLLIQKEDHFRLADFKNTYATLLLNDRIPLFKLETVMLLFRKWNRYPEIISDILFVSRKLNKRQVSEAFWFQLIKSSALDKSTKELKLSRLYLLTEIIRAGVLKKEDFDSNGVVIDSIMRISINTRDHVVLRKRLDKNPSHPYHRMFFVVRRLIEQNVSKLELAEIMRCHFSPPDPDILWSEEVRSMYLTLESKIPANFLLDLKRHEFQKLHFLYTIQPTLFGKLPIHKDSPLTFRELVDLLFEDFTIDNL